MPPLPIPGMMFWGGADVGAAGSGALCSAVGVGAIVASGVDGAAGAVSSAAKVCVETGGSVGCGSAMMGTAGAVVIAGARRVSTTGGLPAGLGWAFGSDWTLVISCDGGGMTGLAGADASPDDCGTGPILGPALIRSLRVST